MTSIEWTEATWNPIVGCSVISPGCTNCYAMRMAHRLAANPATPHYAGTVQMSKAGPVWTGKLALAPDRALTEPLRRRKPTMYFVNSMGDLFHEGVPDDWIDRVFAVMALAPQHTFQVLTKRADRMREYLSDPADRSQCWWAAGDAMACDLDLPLPSVEPLLKFDGTPNPLPNVWLGVSAEDQTRADARIPDLLATPAAVRFVSAEPLLGPVDLTSIARRGGTGLMRALDGRFNTINWVICGGESGKGARPMHPDWTRSLRDQCQAAGVPFFFKQTGAWTAWEETGSPPYWRNSFTGSEVDRHVLFPSNWDAADDWDDGLNFVADAERHCAFQRVGKRAAGRLLDGREWNGMPERAE